MVSRIVNQSVAVVQRFPYLGMFSSVVRRQFFIDLPDVIDGFRGLVSESLQLGVCTVVVVAVPAIVAAREPLGLYLGGPWPLATPPETKDRTSQPPEWSCQSP